MSMFILSKVGVVSEYPLTLSGPCLNARWLCWMMNIWMNLFEFHPAPAVQMPYFTNKVQQMLSVSFHILLTFGGLP